MSEMIERVAKILFDNIQSKMPDFKPLDWDKYNDQNHFKSMARAAIEAMKEPTEEMMKIIDCKHGWHEGECDCKNIYVNMIEASLK